MGVPQQVTKAIPWKQIRVVDDANVRQDSIKRAEMAQSLKERGQLQPVLVTNGGDKEQPYTLVAGHRRMVGFEDNKWTDRDVMCVVREYKKGDAIARLIDNWRENSDREDVSSFDLAQRAQEFVTGTYPVLDGEEQRSIPKAEVAEMLGISTSQLNNLLRVAKNIVPEIAKKARRAGVPLRVLVAWAGIEAKGRDDEAKAEDLAAKQTERFEEWQAAQKELEDSGRKRGPRGKSKSSGGGDGEGEEKAGVLSPDKRIPSGYTDRAKDEDSEPKVRKFTTKEYLTVLRAKQSGTKDKDEVARLQGAIDALRFLTGEVGKLPGLTVGDFAVLAAAEEEEEEDSEE